MMTEQKLVRELRTIKEVAITLPDVYNGFRELQVSVIVKENVPYFYETVRWNKSFFDIEIKDHKIVENYKNEDNKQKFIEQKVAAIDLISKMMYEARVSDIKELHGMKCYILLSGTKMVGVEIPEQSRVVKRNIHGDEYSEYVLDENKRKDN